MSAHTPGPWTLQPIGDETECNILGARRELVATVSDNDACLIAASPELLEALEAISKGLTNGQKERGETLQSIARAAIAKAKGESK